jgi:hypothetical protein
MQQPPIELNPARQYLQLSLIYFVNNHAEGVFGTSGATSQQRWLPG